MCEKRITETLKNAFWFIEYEPNDKPQTIINLMASVMFALLVFDDDERRLLSVEIDRLYPNEPLTIQLRKIILDIFPVSDFHRRVLEAATPVEKPESENSINFKP